MIRTARVLYGTTLPGTEALGFRGPAIEIIREDEVERAFWRMVAFLGLVLALTAGIIGWEHHVFGTWMAAKVLPALELGYGLYYALWLRPRAERNELPVPHEVAVPGTLEIA